MNLISVMKSMYLFNGLCLGQIRVLYLVNLLFLKIIFILISLALLVVISNSCVSRVATNNIYLLSFVALVLLGAVYLLSKYFFPTFQFFRKGIHQESNGIF